MKVFVFPNFLELLFEKNFHFMAHGASWRVPISIRENRIQKPTKLTSLQHFEVDLPGKLSKMKVYVFQNFIEILFKKNFHFMAHWGF